PMERTCRDLTGTFVARLGEFGVGVVDGAKADDPRGDPSAMVKLLRDQFTEIAAKVPAEAWITSHRPFNSMRIDSRDVARDEVDNRVQELAFGPVMPGGVRMSVAGHLHFFQAVDFGAARPPQLVVGTGGDNLSVVPPVSMVGADIAGPSYEAHLLTRCCEPQILTIGDRLWKHVGDLCDLTFRLLRCGVEFQAKRLAGGVFKNPNILAHQLLCLSGKMLAVADIEAK